MVSKRIIFVMKISKNFVEFFLQCFVKLRGIEIMMGILYYHTNYIHVVVPLLRIVTFISGNDFFSIVLNNLFLESGCSDRLIKVGYLEMLPKIYSLHCLRERVIIECVHLIKSLMKNGIYNFD